GEASPYDRAAAEVQAQPVYRLTTHRVDADGCNAHARHRFGRLHPRAQQWIGARLAGDVGESQGARLDEVVEELHRVPLGEREVFADSARPRTRGSAPYRQEHHDDAEPLEQGKELQRRSPASVVERTDRRTFPDAELVRKRLRDGRSALRFHRREPWLV